jgi:hypothetical protein
MIALYIYAACAVAMAIGFMLGAALCSGKQDDLQAQTDDMVRKLRNLAAAESRYRSSSIRFGEDRHQTIEAWRGLQRAGDEARRDLQLTGGR